MSKKRKILIEGAAGRKATTKSISMLPNDPDNTGVVNWEWVEKRVRQLGTRVKGVTHYFQLLAEYDKEYNLLERIIGGGHAGEGSGEQTAKNMAKAVLGQAAQQPPPSKRQQSHAAK